MGYGSLMICDFSGSEANEQGGYSLISTDSETGKRSVVISSSTAENGVIDIFKAQIDRHGSVLAVIFDANISELEQNQLLPLSQAY